MDTVNCDELSTRQINERLRSLPDGSEVFLTHPRGKHSLAVGLTNHIEIIIDGNAGYYIGGLGDGPNITVLGFVGWGVGENLMSGTIRVKGNASESAGATAHGGLIVVEGDSSLRTGISLKGGTLAVAGDVGAMSAFMAQAGTILIGGNAGEALGDSLYEAIIYVGGSIRSLGSDARMEELTEGDVLKVKELTALAGFEHIEPENVKKVASAKLLYNFDAVKAHNY